MTLYIIIPVDRALSRAGGGDLKHHHCLISSERRDRKKGFGGAGL